MKTEARRNMVAYLLVNEMVNPSLYTPGQALRVPGFLGSQVERQLAHEGGKVVSPTHRPPLLPREIFLLLFSISG